jgi:hypothetical protein
MNETARRVLCWAPRIICIAFGGGSGSGRFSSRYSRFFIL